ncbi:MAG: AHH domain-containing protein, partial [Lachnospiraceae bacterium]|nr:AHH domain-containing protein [Lachnospiraceae bacterium]
VEKVQSLYTDPIGIVDVTPPESTSPLQEEGISEILDVGDGVLLDEGGLDTLSTPSSKVLRQNLIDAGVEVPDYPNAAHHIVAGSSPKAAEARAILQKYGVDINDAANGTFLPTVKDVAEGAYHPSLHTNAYYDKINKLLSEATCKEDVLDILEFIGDELSSGTFMQ